MNIEKETTVKVLATDGSTINKGDCVVFNAAGKCITGYFDGFGKRGALVFKSVISGTDVTFHVLPRSIDTIYLAEVRLNKVAAEREEK